MPLVPAWANTNVKENAAMSRSTDANILNRQAQAVLGGAWIDGLFAQNYSENRDEALVPVFGTEVARVRSRILNSNASLGASTFGAVQSVQRALSGWNPDLKNTGLWVRGKYRMPMPLIFNILNEDSTAYQQGIYVGEWNGQPTPPMEGGPNDEFVRTFAGITDREVVEIQGGFFYTEKAACANLDDAINGTGNGTATLTLSGNSVQPDGCPTRGIDMWVVVDPGGSYSAETNPYMCAKVHAGSKCVASNGTSVTITPHQASQLPQGIKDAITVDGRAAFVLAVMASTVLTANSDVATLSFTPTNVWSTIA